METKHERAYFALAELIERAGSEADIESSLALIRDFFGLQTVAYFGQHINPRADNDPYLAVTYSSEWVHHYILNGYVDIDPVIREGFRSILPIDWRNFDQQDKKIRQLFGEANEFGIGRSGVTYPLRDQHGARALFTVTSNAKGVHWNREVMQVSGEFQILAGMVHDMIRRIEGYENVEYHLAPRELECLKWACRGKTASECGDILALSERTVRCYLDTARHKMNATNIAHAVAKAVAHGMIATV